MTPRNPNYRQFVETIFQEAAFVNDLGIQLRDLAPGWCETDLELLPRHLQQDGFVHAGVQATLADHSAGAAAGTLAGAEERVLSVEFKINLLRPAQGERLFCRAEVLKGGRNLSVVESSLYSVQGPARTLVSKATVTLTLLKLA